MLFQVKIDGDCYVVECYFTIGTETIPHWHPLRKFLYQGDAIGYKNWDCPDLGWEMLVQLAKKYDNGVAFERLDKNRFLRRRL